MRKSWTIGRKNSDILLENQNISRLHAMLEFIEGKFYIEDLNSTNGTRIQRKKDFIQVSKSVELFSGDKLFFSDFSISFEELKNKVDIGKITPEVIRCKECLKPISNQKPCSFCGSILHLGSET